MTQRRRFALPHGIELDALVAGPEGAPLLLFLHGFPEAAFIWEPLLAHFGARHRCIAPDLRGYGASSAPAGVEAYRAKALLQDLEALIAATTGGAPLAALVAHDWGGALAWGLAMRRPELMARLVIVNAPHPGPFLRDLLHDPAQQAASAYMNFLCRPDAAERLAADDHARLFGFFTRMGGEAWLTPALRERYREVWSRGLDPMLNYYRASPLRPATDTDRAIHAVSFADAQITVRVPTTVVWGDGDTALPWKLVDGLERWVPALRIARVAGASHWLIHEQPERVIAEIETALGAS